MSKLLAEKVAIVTGGGKGLGSAIGLALAVDGAKVLLVSRDDDALRSSEAKVREYGGTATVLATDLTAPDAAQSVVARALDEFGGLDILVNCAGVFTWKRFFDLSSDDWDTTIATNLTAPFFLSREAARAMVEQGRGGCIVNIASIHGLVGDPNVVPHCASKAGLIGMTKAMAEALREDNIRVNAIAPGAIEPNTEAKRGESTREKVTQSDVASLAAYLASDLSRSVTGAVIEAYGSTRTVIKA
jgi:NAD(P)-dependent dehydrogenase (short-subunit alcohol dehydrogenase family)